MFPSPPSMQAGAAEVLKTAVFARLRFTEDNRARAIPEAAQTDGIPGNGLACGGDCAGSTARSGCHCCRCGRRAADPALSFHARRRVSPPPEPARARTGAPCDVAAAAHPHLAPPWVCTAQAAFAARRRPPCPTRPRRRAGLPLHDGRAAAFDHALHFDWREHAAPVEIERPVESGGGGIMQGQAGARRRRHVGQGGADGREGDQLRGAAQGGSEVGVVASAAVIESTPISSRQVPAGATKLSATRWKPSRGPVSSARPATPAIIAQMMPSAGAVPPHASPLRDPVCLSPFR